MTKSILYIQHAGALGGSCMSLLYLIQGLDPNHYSPVVATIYNEPSVMNLYRDAGIETLYWPGIGRFDHTTLGWHTLYNPLDVAYLLRQMIQFPSSVRATRALVEQIKPDLVHLNSLVLAPSAIGVKQTKTPLVWHVREPVSPGHIGLRRRILSRLFTHFADEGIFISEYDRQQLTQGTKGTVVYNFVDFARFDHTITGKEVRNELGLSSDAKVILFLGGRSVVKGIFPLLKAMPQVKQHIVDVHLLVGGGVYHSSGRLLSRFARFLLPLFGSGTVAQRVDKTLDRHALRDCVHLLKWRTDIPQLLAACDLLVFPSITPHFARPVIEAGAMAKPVVASRIGGVEELVVDGETGKLVPPNNPQALAEALVSVLSSPDNARRMGENGCSRAHQLFNAETNVCATIDVYHRILSDCI